MVEILGVVASVIIAISFFTNGEKRIRIVNTVGSVMFAAYGLLIGSISIILLNTISVIVNLIKIKKLKEEIKNDQNDNSNK